VLEITESIRSSIEKFGGMLNSVTYQAVNFGKRVFCTIFNCVTFSKLGNAIKNAAGKMY